MVQVLSLVKIMAICYEHSGNFEPMNTQCRVFFELDGRVLQKVFSVGVPKGLNLRPGSFSGLDISGAEAAETVESGIWYQPFTHIRVYETAAGYQPRYQLSDGSWSIGPYRSSYQEAMDLMMIVWEAHRVAQNLAFLELPRPSDESFWPK